MKVDMLTPSAEQSKPEILNHGGTEITEKSKVLSVQTDPKVFPWCSSLISMPRW